MEFPEPFLLMGVCISTTTLKMFGGIYCAYFMITQFHTSVLNIYECIHQNLYKNVRIRPQARNSQSIVSISSVTGK